MMHNESTVLPAAAAFVTKECSAPLLENKLNSLFCSWSSRLTYDDRWIADNRYFKPDEPNTSHAADMWEHLYKELDKIQVIGLIKQQWALGQEETKQIP
jgi:hypothetical protein